jgi:hypothetical protein
VSFLSLFFVAFSFGARDTLTGDDSGDDYECSCFFGVRCYCFCSPAAFFVTSV